MPCLRAGLFQHKTKTMKKIQFEINGKTYNLKFGYGCLRLLAEKYGIGLQELFERFGNVSGKEIETAVDLVWAAVTAAGDTVDIDEVGDFLLQEPKKIEEVMQGLMDSLPKADEPEGKPEPAEAPGTPNP